MIASFDVLVQHGQAVLLGDLVDERVIDTGDSVLFDGVPLGMAMEEGAELVQGTELGAVAGDSARVGVDDFPQVEVKGAEDLGIVRGRFFGELKYEGAGLGR